MKKREFNKIKAENPESRIGQRTLGYQKARDGLAKVLNTGDEKNETSARINYLVEKTFSKEKLKKEDYDFILGLSTQDLEKFHSKIEDKVLGYRYNVLDMSEIHEDAPYEEDEDGLFAGNKMLRFISQTRNDVFSEMFRAVRYHTRVKIGEKGLEERNNDMKSIYPNREDMVAANEADAKSKKEKLKQSRKDSLKDENRKEVFEKIYGDKEGVIKDLKENFVNIEENVEMFGQKGKKVTLELPEVGDFKGFKFESFISDEIMNAKDLKKAPRLEKQLYSMKEIGNLLLAIRKYMEQYDVELDGHYYYNYEYRLKEDHDSDAGKCLNSILDLDDTYWLKNTILLGQENGRTIKFRPHMVLGCHEDRCGFFSSKNKLEFDDLGEILMNRIDGGMFGCCEGIDDAKILAKMSLRQILYY